MPAGCGYSCRNDELENSDHLIWQSKINHSSRIRDNLPHHCLYGFLNCQALYSLISSKNTSAT